MSHAIRNRPNYRQSLSRAVALLRAGRLPEAEFAARQVLAAAPADPDALNILGSVALQSGQIEAALTILRQATLLAPNAVEPRINLGHALKALGCPAEAIACYREAVRLRPGDADARYALGNGLLAAGDLPGAEAELREAARRAPRFAQAYNNLGHVLRLLRRPAEAEVQFRKALRLDPGQVEWHLNLALAVGEQHRTPDALAALQAALRVAPHNVVALNAYGNLLVRSKLFEQAVAPLRRLRALQPGTPDPFAGLAQTLTALGEFNEALDVARETVDRVPDSAGAHSNLGSVLLALGALPEAEAAFETALRLEPDHALARTGRAYTRLRCGRLEEAWDDYEARLDAQRMVSNPEVIALTDPADFASAMWTGAPRNGRSLLVYAEQGLGDTIQMARYAALLKDDGPVFWIVDPALRGLLSGLRGVTALLTPADPIPDHDLHISVMSLPRAFRTSLATIPGDVPYLHADPSRAAMWRARLRSIPGRKVGLAWQGNPDYLLDRLRSVPPACLRALDGVRDTTFISLQLPRPAVPPPLAMVDLTAGLSDFADTAALMEVLDLIITVDTSIVHLAGALGRPVWLLNRFNTDWRWLDGRDDSPWYPTARIFRQTSPRDWDNVLTTVRIELEACAASADPYV